MTKAFFSFDYSDFNNAAIIQNAFGFKRVAMPIFIEQAKWNNIIKKGEEFTKKFIKSAVLSSDVTVFLVGENSFRYKMCQYALQICSDNRKGIVGIYLPNQMHHGSSNWLTKKGIRVHEWDSQYVSDWIKQATYEPVK